MNEEIIDEKYIIKYSNHLFFNDRRLAFRKKLLFDITTDTPKLVPKSEQGWWINRKLLTIKKAEELCNNISVEVDITHLQWYIQVQLDECFNLK